MKILAAKGTGFCFGVKRAINIAFDVAKKEKSGVYTFGPIIHNPQVIERLKTVGVMPIESLRGLRKKGLNAVIIRTHGVPADIMQRLEKIGCKIIDATCPYVKKAQQYAKLLCDEGYQVVILGDKRHPEVEGIMSYAGKNAVVVDAESGIPHLKSRVGIVVQTTQPLEALRGLLSSAIGQTKEIKVYNTICSSTALRLEETETVARKADVMIVVGGKNSANTTQLANLCRSLSVPTYHIETASEIKEKWMKGSKVVGITAGASTPDWIINDVKKRIKDIGGSPCYGNREKRA
ncbi:MAG: 4-hydroxy-3-methylbut-2-enyl diphosphate reductase [Thermodesulfovibrionales bacterium]|nr:4-hydroxy-3-methylbut-2-enyl diphosphate reductase [Thermodesulfovibrionales bacterium]